MGDTMKKGQMFIIAAIIVSISLILLKEYFGVFSIIEEKRHQNAESLSERMANIQAEYMNIVNVAMENSDVNASAIGQLYNFSQYLQQQEDIEILYMFVYVNKSRNEMQVVLGNFMGDTIDVLLNTTGTVFSEQTATLFDKETAEMLFYIQPEYDSLVNITLEYELQDEFVIERASIDASGNSQLLFYDFAVSSGASSSRVKDVYNPVLNQFVELPGPEQNPAAYCGNGICDASETCATCYRDCCPGQCGNNVCEGAYGETCETCSADCGACGNPPCLPPKCKDTQQGGGTQPCCSECYGDPECLGNCDPNC